MKIGNENRNGVTHGQEPSIRGELVSGGSHIDEQFLTNATIVVVTRCHISLRLAFTNSVSPGP